MDFVRVSGDFLMEYQIVISQTWPSLVIARVHALMLTPFVGVDGPVHALNLQALLSLQSPRSASR